MADEFRYPEGYDPNTVPAIEKQLIQRGYKREQDGDQWVFKHPGTGHVVNLSEEKIPEKEFHPEDDMEM